jgi:hypothetical protein
MGQQQLLLIILGVIVVGIAVAVGITMFKDNAVSANRDAVTNDLVNLASRAQQYYRRPAALGGGEGKFDGLTDIKQLTSMPGGKNPNGTYTFTPGTGNGPVVIKGTGTEIGYDNATAVKVVMNVYPDSAKVDASQTN